MGLFEDLTTRNNGDEVDVSWWNSIITALRTAFPDFSALSGDVVGTTDSQTLTNKTIDADNNTISNLAHGAEVDNPTSGVHGVTGSVVGTTDTQDLSNKTITDALTLEEQASTPSNPASGDKKLYAKNDGKVYTLDSTGAEVEVGSGAGGGTKTYIDNDSAKLETGVGSWATDNGAGSSATTITLSQNTTTPLSGDGDLSFAKSAADGNGEFAKLTTETIDRSDYGKILFFSCNFDATDSNYASNLEFEFYDNTNAAVLYAGSSEDLAVTKTEGKFTAPVYLESTTAEIEVRIKINDTDATAYTVYFDDFKLGPAAQVNTVYRKSQTIDLTGSGDFNGGEIQVERVGNVVTISALSNLTRASASASIASATGLLPEWARPEAGGFRFNTPAHNTSGYLYRNIVYDTGQIIINFIQEDLSTGSSQVSDAGTFNITYTVPDTAGPTLTENELSLQTVQVDYSLNSSTANTAWADGVYEIVDYNIKNIDTHNAVTTGSSWRFTAPKSALYHVSAGLRWSTSSNLTNSVLGIAKNGTASFDRVLDFPEDTTRTLKGEAYVYLDKDDYIDIKARQIDSTSASRDILQSGTYGFISIKEQPDYTVLGAVKERNRIQTKYVAADATDGDLSELTFSNLVIGKWYEVTGQVDLVVNNGGADPNATLIATHDSAIIYNPQLLNRQGTSTAGDAIAVGVAFKFKATATTLTFSAGSASANSYVSGDGTKGSTYMQLEERNDLIETSDFD